MKRVTAPLPRLACDVVAASLSAALLFAAAMAASISHRSKVRGGKLVPHKRHWESLRLIAKQAL